MMKKLIAVILILSLSLLTPSLCLAEKWNSFFGNALEEIENAFSNDGTSEEEEAATENSIIGDLGTIIGGIFSEDNALPKEIHYGDFELFKQDIDTLEIYFQAYADFMADYDPSDFSMLAEYTSLMAKYVEAMEVLESLDQTKMTHQEEKYYLEVLIRINKILYSSLEEMNM